MVTSPRLVAARATIMRHSSTDPASLQARDQLLRLLDDASCDPFARTSFAPGHLTASAIVLDPSRTKVLLIHHSKLGLWLQPGGHIDPSDEDLVAAARRELREETHIAAAALLHRHPFHLDVHDIPPGRDPAHKHFDVRFLFEAPDLAFRAASDASAARWVRPSELPSLNTDDSVRRAVSAAFASSH